MSGGSVRRSRCTPIQEIQFKIDTGLQEVQQLYMAASIGTQDFFFSVT